MKHSISLFRQQILIIGLLAGMIALGIVFAPRAHALTTPPITTVAQQCADIKNSNDAKGSKNGSTCIFTNYVNPFIKFLSAMTGLIVVISIVVGGIQYSTAGGDPGKVAAAKTRITQAIIALLIFIFLLSFLQWVVPGGISGKA